MTDIAARDLLAAEQLPFPSLPPDLEARLAPASANMFSTRPLEVGLYQIDFFVEMALAGACGEGFAAVGFDGYGVNSWALHVYVVEGPRAVFLQLPWGGVYLDADEARADIVETFAWIDRVTARLGAADGRGQLSAGQRLCIVDAGFGSSGWGWFTPRTPADVALRLTRLDRAGVERALDMLESGGHRA